MEARPTMPSAKALGHVEHGGAQGFGVAHRLAPSRWRQPAPPRAAVVVLQRLGVGLGVSQNGAVGVDDGQPLVRRGGVELLGQAVGIVMAPERPSSTSSS